MPILTRRKKEPKVIILAAGKGARLRPLTDDRPKCLIEINGLSLLDLQLGVIKACGCNDITIVGGYKADQIVGRTTKYYINSNFDSTNMVTTLFCAEEEIHGTVIVSYGDIVYSRECLEAMLCDESSISVAVDRNWESYWRKRFANPTDDAESLNINHSGRITEIGQPLCNSKMPEAQYIGLTKFSGEGVIQLKHIYHSALKTGTLRNKPVQAAYMTDLLQALIEKGSEVVPVTISGNWLEIDSPRDYNLPVTRSRFSAIRNEINR